MGPVFFHYEDDRRKEKAREGRPFVSPLCLHGLLTIHMKTVFLLSQSLEINSIHLKCHVFI